MAWCQCIMAFSHTASLRVGTLHSIIPLREGNIFSQTSKTQNLTTPYNIIIKNILWMSWLWNYITSSPHRPNLTNSIFIVKKGQMFGIIYYSFFLNFSFSDFLMFTCICGYRLVTWDRLQSQWLINIETKGPKSHWIEVGTSVGGWMWGMLSYPSNKVWSDQVELIQTFWFLKFQ